MKRMLHILVREQIALSLLLLLFSFSVFAQQKAGSSTTKLTTDEQKVIAKLESKTIREVTTALASKEMEGRGTGQPGADRAARYLADRFAELGLRPGGDARTYLQAVKFKIEQPSPESSFKAADTIFKYNEDFRLPLYWGSESKEVSGKLVFAGFGFVSKEFNHDDLKGIDIKGKIVMVLTGKPKNIADNIWAKITSGPQFEALVERGAAGIIVVWNEAFSLAGNHPTRHQAIRLAEFPYSSSKIPPVIFINERTAEKLFVGQDITFVKAADTTAAGEWASRELNTSISLSVRYKREEKTGSNVVAVLEGSDPALKDEAVVFTAHYDGYGIDANGTIYPGASDNALGVGKLIAIAKSLKRASVRLRRSIIFFSSIGEEYGWLGTRYWVDHPTWPIEKIAANINYDGIGTDAWGPQGIIVDYKFNHSDLGSVIKDVATLNGIDIIPDPIPAHSVFYRSDHYVFSVKGVPSLLLVGAPKPDNMIEFLKRVNNWIVTSYHMPTDTIKPDWNWEGPRALSILGAVTGMRVANQQALPTWRSDSPYNRPRGNQLPAPPRP